MAWGRGIDHTCGTCDSFNKNECDPKVPGRYKCNRHSTFRENAYVYPTDKEGSYSAALGTTVHGCWNPKRCWITTVVYNILLANAKEEDVVSLQLESGFLFSLQKGPLSENYSKIWAQYSYIGYLIAQYIKGLPAEQALNIAKRIHDEYFVDIINNPTYTMEDRCLKYIEMYEDMKRYFGIDAAMEGLLYDDNTLPVPVDPCSLMQNVQGPNHELRPVNSSNQCVA